MKSSERKIESLFLTGAEKKADDEEQKKLFERYEKIVAQEERGSAKWIKWHMDTTARIVELDCGRLVAIRKENIETQFCFGYSDFGNYQHEDAANDAYEAHSDGGEYFYQENLRSKFDVRIDDLMAAIERPARYVRVSGAPYRLNGSEEHAYYDIFSPAQWDCWGEEMDAEHGYKPLTDNDMQKLLRAYRIERGKFEKRLQTYLKRYGTDKLHAWTFWIDE